MIEEEDLVLQARSALVIVNEMILTNRGVVELYTGNLDDGKSFLKAVREL